MPVKVSSFNVLVVNIFMSENFLPKFATFAFVVKINCSKFDQFSG